MSAPPPQVVVTGASSIVGGRPQPVLVNPPPPPPAALAQAPQVPEQAPGTQATAGVSVEGRTFASPDAAAKFLQSQHPGSTVTYTTTGTAVKFTITGGQQGSATTEAGQPEYSVSFPDPLFVGPVAGPPGSPGGTPLIRSPQFSTPEALASWTQARLGRGAVVTPVYSGGQFTSLNIELPRQAPAQAPVQLNPVESAASYAYGGLVTFFGDVFSAGQAAGSGARGGLQSAGLRVPSVQVRPGYEQRLATVTETGAYLFPGGAVLHGVGTPSEGLPARGVDVVFGSLPFLPLVGEAAAGARVALAARLAASPAGRAAITAGEFAVSPAGRFAAGTTLGTAGGLAYGESPTVAFGQGLATGALFVLPELPGAVRSGVSWFGRRLAPIYEPVAARVGPYARLASLAADEGGASTMPAGYLAAYRAPEPIAGEVPAGFPGSEFRQAAGSARSALGGSSYPDVQRVAGEPGPLGRLGVPGRASPIYTPEFDEAQAITRSNLRRVLEGSPLNRLPGEYRVPGEYGQAEPGFRLEPMGRAGSEGPAPSLKAPAEPEHGASNEEFAQGFRRAAREAGEQVKTAKPTARAEEVERQLRDYGKAKTTRAPASAPAETGGAQAENVGSGGAVAALEERPGRAAREEAEARIRGARRSQRPPELEYATLRYPPGTDLGAPSPQSGAVGDYIRNLRSMPSSPGELSGARTYDLGALGEAAIVGLGLRGSSVVSQRSLSALVSRQDLGLRTDLVNTQEQVTGQVRAQVLDVDVPAPTVLRAEEEGALFFPGLGYSEYGKKRVRERERFAYLEVRRQVRIELGGPSSLRRFIPKGRDPLGAWR